MAMQLIVKWLDLLPQAGGFLFEFGRAHVEAGTPHFAEIVVTQFAGALVNKLNVALVFLAHGRSDRAPALPGVGQLVEVSAAGKNVLEFRQALAVAVIAAVLPCSVHTLKLGRNQRELFTFCGIGWRWQRCPQLQEIDRATRFGAKLGVFVRQCLLHHVAMPLRKLLAGCRSDDRCVRGYVGRSHPLGGAGFLEELGELFVGPGNKLLGCFRRWGDSVGSDLVGFLLGTGAENQQREARCDFHKRFHCVLPKFKREINVCRASSDAAPAR